MKRYVRMIPLIIYPYAWIIALGILFVIGMINNEILEWKYFSTICNGIFIAYQVMVLITAIYGAISGATGDSTPLQEAVKNLVIKCIHIPAYVLHFMMGLLGLCMSVWGIGFILFAVIVDVLTIALSGIQSIGCAVKFTRENIISKGKAVIMVIGSFIFCIDIVVALIYLIMAGKSRKSDIYKM